jgi:hypothetical protein
LNIICREAMLFAAWLLDFCVRLKPGRVVFVTRANAPLAGNLRIVLDAALLGSAREIGLFKEGPIPPETLEVLQARGVRVFQNYGLRALLFILGSQRVVLSHSARDAYLTRRKRGRRITNLWHGVALKRIEAMMLPRGSRVAYLYRRRFIRRNARLYDAVIASNDVDRLVNSLAFGVAHEKVHATGLPRLDYLRSDYSWPADLEAQRQRLAGLCAGSRLVLYAPTFRDSGTHLHELITREDLVLIRAFCRNNGAILGLRTHPYRTHEAAALCDGADIINLSPDIFPEPAVPLAAAKALIVDYSSIWIDYLLRDKPMVAYVPDRDKYTGEDRGFIYDFDEIFPGPIVKSWPAVLAHLDRNLRGTKDDALRTKYERAKTLFLPPPGQDRDLAAKCWHLIEGL